jgi:mono/diheme cytochrome c family protein
MERMKAAGMGMSAAEAAKLAQQSKSMLLDRLHRGGQDMPAFPHLGDAEVNSLVAYLRLLAGVPGAQGEQLAVQESRLRVGEHIVKSTCHICHSAAGPNPDPQQLYEGAIPPLSALPLRTSRAEFVRKVTHGAPVVMGAPQQLFRGRMPVFYYLSEDEAADVYLYLGRYPPYQWATFDPGAKSTSAIPPTDQTPVYPAPQVAGELVTGNAGLVEVQPAMTAADTRFEALPVLAGLVAIVLLGLGLGFTVYELMRLSRLREGREWASASVSVKKAFEIGEPRAPVNDHVDRELVA